MVKQGFDPFRFQDERLSTFGLIKPTGEQSNSAFEIPIF